MEVYELEEKEEERRGEEFRCSMSIYSLTCINLYVSVLSRTL